MSSGKVTASNAVPEARIIARVQKGDEQAFAELYEKHKRRVYSLCLRMTGNAAEAEDLTQEAFLQVFRKISTFRGEASFATWLHRLAVNVVLMHLRRKGPLPDSLDETETSRGRIVHRDLCVKDTRLAMVVDRMGLERALSELAAGYRVIFVLHDIEGYEHKEIAQIMGCSVGNVKSQLHEARMKLREWFLAQPQKSPDEPGRRLQGEKDVIEDGRDESPPSSPDSHHLDAVFVFRVNKRCPVERLCSIRIGFLMHGV